MNIPVISIIFPTYNGKKDTLDYLESIYTVNTYPHNALDVIMIDNGSKDNTSGTVRKKFPQVTTIEISENIGPGAARNKGLKHSAGDIIFFSDNDQVLEADTLEKMAKWLEEKDDPVIAGARVFHKNPWDKHLSSGYLWNRWLGIEQSNPHPQRVSRVDWVSACAMMIKREDLHRLNGFNTQFFFFAEDADLCLRAYKKGFRVYSLPFASVHHDRSITPTFCKKEMYYQYYISKFLLILRHSSFAQKIVSILAHLCVFPYIRIIQRKNEFPILKIKAFIKACIINNT